MPVPVESLPESAGFFMRRASTSRILPESAVPYRTEKGWAGIAFPVLGAVGPVGGVGGGGDDRYRNQPSLGELAQLCHDSCRDLTCTLAPSPAFTILHLHDELLSVFAWTCSSDCWFSERD